MHDNLNENSHEKTLEKIYIIQPITKENADNYRILQEEAISLIESAGAAYVGTITQNIREINPATFIGEGKLASLAELLNGLEDITVLFNGELSPSQTLNISAALGDRKVIDRTTLILDIFAKNAKSSEGKLQVELAQLKYIYPRLKGKGAALSRLGGGVGTRGPGETQLETDRRYIRGRIQYLESRLKETEKRRALLSERRKKDAVKTIALVGYTNTGKSTLLNLLTGANVYAKDELFATLDPTSRELDIDGAKFILVDTVGFLQDLPHHLIEAFHSTLESALSAALALIVCDAQGEYETQLKTTLHTLQDLHFSQKTLIVMNKCENISDTTLFPLDSVAISAKHDIGIDALKREILKQFRDEIFFCTLFVPYEKLNEYGKVKKFITEKKTVFSDDGLTIDAVVTKEHADKIKPFLTQMLR